MVKNNITVDNINHSLMTNIIDFLKKDVFLKNFLKDLKEIKYYGFRITVSETNIEELFSKIERLTENTRLSKTQFILSVLHKHNDLESPWFQVDVLINIVIKNLEKVSEQEMLHEFFEILQTKPQINEIINSWYNREYQIDLFFRTIFLGDKNFLLTSYLLILPKFKIYYSSPEYKDSIDILNKSYKNVIFKNIKIYEGEDETFSKRDNLTLRKVFNDFVARFEILNPKIKNLKKDIENFHVDINNIEEQKKNIEEILNWKDTKKKEKEGDGDGEGENKPEIKGKDENKIHGEKDKKRFYFGKKAKLRQQEEKKLRELEAKLEKFIHDLSFNLKADGVIYTFKYKEKLELLLKIFNKKVKDLESFEEKPWVDIINLESPVNVVILSLIEIIKTKDKESRKGETGETECDSERDSDSENDEQQHETGRDRHKNFKTKRTFNQFLKEKAYNIGFLKNRITTNLEKYIFEHYLPDIVVPKRSRTIITSNIHSQFKNINRIIDEFCGKAKIANIPEFETTYEERKADFALEDGLEVKKKRRRKVTTAKITKEKNENDNKNLLLVLKNYVNTEKHKKKIYAKLKLEDKINPFKELIHGIFLKITERLIESLFEAGILIENETIVTHLNDQARTFKTFKFNREFYNNLIWLETSGYTFPTIVAPKNYKFDKKLNSFVGGYHESDYSTENLILKNKSLKTYLTNERLNLINKIQKQPIMINSENLQEFLDLKIKTIEKNLNINFDIFLYELYPELFDKPPNCRDEELNVVIEFLKTIYVADLLKDFKKIWYIRKIDGRLRIYFLGYPLNFISAKYSRIFFKAPPSKDAKHKKIKEKLRIVKEVEKIIHLWIDDKDEKFNFISLLLDPFTSLVGLDASSQIFQIMGCLTLNEKLLKHTHLIKGDGQKIDIYTNLLNRFEKSIEDHGVLNSKIMAHLEKIYETKSLTEKLLFYPDSVWFELRKNINRKWIKKAIMPYAYNKSFNAMCETSTAMLLKTSNNIVKKYQYQFNAISSMLLSKLLKIFEEEYKGLKTLRWLFKNISNLAGELESSIVITTQRIDDKNKRFNEINGFEQKYKKFINEYKPKRIIKFISYNKEQREKTGKKGRTISIDIMEFDPKDDRYLKYDTIKNSNGLLPNTAHFLDASILYDVLTHASKKNIILYTIHDAFYSTLDNKEVIKDIYIEAVKNTFKSNFLENLIINNFIHFSNQNKEFKDVLTTHFPNILEEGKIVTNQKLKRVIGIDNDFYERILKILNIYLEISNQAILNFDFNKLESFLKTNFDEDYMKF